MLHNAFLPRHAPGDELSRPSASFASAIAARMGNLSSTVSDANFTEAALKRTLDADQQILGHYLATSDALADAGILSSVYREVVSGVGQQGSSSATALSSWLPPLQHERNW